MNNTPNIPFYKACKKISTLASRMQQLLIYNL